MAGIYGYGNIQLNEEPICAGSISLEREFNKFTYKYFNSEEQQFFDSEIVDLDSVVYYVTYSLEEYPSTIFESLRVDSNFILNFSVYDHQTSSSTDYSFDSVHVVSVSTVAIGQPLTVKFVANTEGQAAASSLLVGLDAYWRLDEPPGITKVDEINGYLMSEVGVSPLASGQGVQGNAVVFDRDNRLVNNDVETFLFDTTISVWASFDSNDGTSDYVLSRASSTGDGEQFQLVRVGSGTLIFTLASDQDERLIIPVIEIEVNRFYHFVITYSSSTGLATLYIDSVASGSFVLFDANQVNAPLTIGGLDNGGNGGTMGGKVDELAIWSRSFSQKDVTELYNNGAGLFYPFT